MLALAPQHLGTGCMSLATSVPVNFIAGNTMLNVPDYVLDANYPLMSLADLRTYIAREKH